MIFYMIIYDQKAHFTLKEIERNNILLEHI